MKSSSFVASALLALALSASASAATDKGGGAVDSGRGFDCKPPATWKVSNGMARCTLPDPVADKEILPCAAANKKHGACTYRLQKVTSGTIGIFDNETAGYSGQMKAECTDGNWSIETPTCAPNPCDASSRTYGACSFNIGSLASGQNSNVSTHTPGYTGSLNASCSLGVLTVTGETCSPVPVNCPSVASQVWGTYCAAPLAAANHGSFRDLVNANAGYDGSVRATCNNGTWQLSSAVCTNPPNDCAAGTGRWGPANACAAPLAATPSGDARAVSYSGTTYSGSAIFSCNDGNWSLDPGSTCDPTIPTPTGINVTLNTYLPLRASLLTTGATVETKPDGSVFIQTYGIHDDWPMDERGTRSCTLVNAGDTCNINANRGDAGQTAGSGDTVAAGPFFQFPAKSPKRSASAWWNLLSPMRPGLGQTTVTLATTCWPGDNEGGLPGCAGGNFTTYPQLPFTSNYEENGGAFGSAGYKPFLAWSATKMADGSLRVYSIGVNAHSTAPQWKLAEQGKMIAGNGSLALSYFVLNPGDTGTKNPTDSIRIDNFLPTVSYCSAPGGGGEQPECTTWE